jgi:hypothetical protein
MSAADSDTEYAYWTAPGNRITVTYSLPVFHEIEFQVSEGFRRIPHGGVETGGLLFGHLHQNGDHISAQIEAFRQIESEHAAGPSFNLSERDVAGVRDQLAAAASDVELEGLQVLGWFVAHTRSPLEMNDREAVLFPQLFPGPGRMLVLVKPERFQATRFAFIVRGADGLVDRDVASNAIILPLQGRAGRSVQGPAASIPAPVQSVAPAGGIRAAAPRAETRRTPAPPPEVRRPAEVRPGLPPEPVVQPEASAPSFWRDVPKEPARQEPVLRIEEPPTEQSGSEGPQASEPLDATALTVMAPSNPATTLPSIEEIKRRRSENVQATSLEPIEGIGSRLGYPVRATRKMNRGGRPSALRLLLLLLLAAGLGCGVGYFAYLQLPSATIPLTVRRAPASLATTGSIGLAMPNLIVSWPPEQTRDAIFASIRVDDGEASPLSAQQRVTGRALIAARSDNVKVELIAQRRWRDSRGIVRYVRAKSVSP